MWGLAEAGTNALAVGSGALLDTGGCGLPHAPSRADATTKARGSFTRRVKRQTRVRATPFGLEQRGNRW